MKKFSLLSACIFSCAIAFAQNDIAIIPQPVKMTTNEGKFTLPARILIQADETPELQGTLDILKSHVTIPTGSTATINTSHY